MSATDFELRRTLTDLVDDELRIHANPVDLQLSHGHDTYYQFGQIAGSIAGTGQEAPLSDEESLNRASSIFSKYADPNITTLEKKSANNGNIQAPIVKQVNLNLTPSQNTVSLNTITPNPFISPRSMSRSGSGSGNGNGNFGLNPSRNVYLNNLRLNFHTRVNDENNGFENGFYDGGYGDITNFLEEDEKLHEQASWDDSNVSGYYWTNDQEFNFDDDLSEEEDDEDSEYKDGNNTLSNELDLLIDQEQLQPSDAEVMGQLKEKSLFIDSERTQDGSQRNLLGNFEQHEEDEDVEEEDDGMFSEDEVDPLYEPSLVGARRKASMVVSHHDEPVDRDILNKKSSRHTNTTKSIPTSIKQKQHRDECEFHIDAKCSSHSSDDQHVCLIINPVTKEPCMKKFSRPYDLIRHQKTIHASKKKIFRCLICIQELGSEGYQRTFSRNDALSRHVKVKHGLQGAEAQKVIQYAKDNVEYQSS